MGAQASSNIGDIFHPSTPNRHRVGISHVYLAHPLQTMHESEVRCIGTALALPLAYANAQISHARLRGPRRVPAGPSTHLIMITNDRVEPPMYNFKSDSLHARHGPGPTCAPIENRFRMAWQNCFPGRSVIEFFFGHLWRPCGVVLDGGCWGIYNTMVAPRCMGVEMVVVQEFLFA